MSVTVEAPIAANAAAVMIAEVAVGRRHTCARTAGGRVWCWGDNAAGQVQAGAGPMVSHPTTLEAHEAGSLSAGGAHTCGLRDEQAICWGSNRDGQLGNADHGAREVVIAAKRFASHPRARHDPRCRVDHRDCSPSRSPAHLANRTRSEEHTSELQSHHDLVCRLLLE